MENCIFCKIFNNQIPSWKVYEDETTFAFLDIHPIARYHTLIIPKVHYETIYDIPEDVYFDIMRTTKTIAELYKEKLGIENVQLFNNSGPLTLQSVFHFHMHVVPRTDEDKHQFNLTVRPELVKEYPVMIEKLR